MPNPTTKSRQELRSRFVRNAIPTEADFADLIAASLNLADDGLRKLPNEPLSLVRQKADQPLLRFFADPTAEGSVWQMNLVGTQETGLGFTNQSGMSILFLDGPTGNVGIGTRITPGKLTITEAVGTRASATLGVRASLVIDHENPLGGGSILFRRKGSLDVNGDYAYMEYWDKNPHVVNADAGLLTIGIQNDADDHIALMPSGNAGINTLTPAYKLDVNGTAGVRGQVNLLTGSNQIRFSSDNANVSGSPVNNVEICNDTVTEKRLIIAGNKSAGGLISSRRIVGIYDDLIVNGIVVRKVWAATGYANDEKNEGQLLDRILNVTKLLGAESVLRITYFDNFRVVGDMAGARWEIRINGQNATPAICLHRYEKSTSNNSHISGTLVGYAKNLKAGTYEIQVWVGTMPGTNAPDVYTGWNGQTWTLEAEEVRLNS
jgi:hypothetical protein